MSAFARRPTCSKRNLIWICRRGDQPVAVRAVLECEGDAHAKCSLLVQSGRVVRREAARISSALCVRGAYLPRRLH
jgi:hypothetical protein